MARMKDETKRSAILQSSKTLFSQKGFYNTSISDIVKETGLPVGTIYTYFKSKDEIVRDIVIEGWGEFYTRLEREIANAATAEEKLRLILDGFIPELLNDLDFINILLTEAVNYTRLEEKIQKLTDLVFGLLRSIAGEGESFQGLTRRDMEALLAVFLTGILNAVKLTRTSSIDLKTGEILSAVKKVVHNALPLAI